MNRGYELAGDKAEKYPWRQVVFAEALAELVVLGEDLGQG